MRGVLLYGVLAVSAFCLTLGFRKLSASRPGGVVVAAVPMTYAPATAPATPSPAPVYEPRSETPVATPAVAPIAVMVPTTPILAAQSSMPAVIPLPIPEPTSTAIPRNAELASNLARAAQEEAEPENRIAAIKALQSLALNRGEPDPELLEAIRVSTTDADDNVAAFARGAYASVQHLTEHR